MQKFWIVWNPAGRNPVYRHEGEESARTEAERLATTVGGEFFVLGVTACCSRDVVKWDECEMPTLHPVEGRTGGDDVILLSDAEVRDFQRWRNSIKAALPGMTVFTVRSWGGCTVTDNVVRALRAYFKPLGYVVEKKSRSPLAVRKMRGEEFETDPFADE